ncbi:LysR family transcriptional regulator [Goodfellowiella coeruleoviolacea]|uniref:DNA-binding transcriptional regulator, LysR family n=1 Tax=Goodfellowiella coeruleoviolacea TaxID=334858 RepID=A0AAE3G9A7_9PSEU|nr:LysR family transcriptional regulator [Goodfellowiella coeruleoviolacea]MCP2164056.1 DNA-binding transcriptional regulator, LysR family [Goodfellowiella coeruleoviolacea]
MRMDLTIQQLRVVIAVHDAGSFTAAAEQLRLAQSSLSRTVLEVERRLGVTLFERTTRRLVPTAEGREFVAIARATTDAFDANLRHFSGFLDGHRGQVRIAALPSLAAILLPPVISAYRRRHNRVELSIEDALADEVLDRVRSGAVDLAVTVVSALAQPLDDLDVSPVATDQFCCVFPRDHRFAGLAELSWADLADEPFISFDRTTSIRQHVELAMAEARVRPHTVIDARNIAAVAGLVAARLGVSVVPGLVLPLTQFAELDHRPLRAPRTSRLIAVVRAPHRPLAPAATAFVDALTDASRRALPLPPETSWLPSPQ